jgi:hypothetical protein
MYRLGLSELGLFILGLHSNVNSAADVLGCLEVPATPGLPDGMISNQKSQFD